SASWPHSARPWRAERAKRLALAGVHDLRGSPARGTKFRDEPREHAGPLDGPAGAAPACLVLLLAILLGVRRGHLGLPSRRPPPDALPAPARQCLNERNQDG